MLYATLPFVLVSLLIEISIGAFVGLLAVALVLRRNLTRRTAIIPMTLGALLFLIGSGLVGWADEKSWINNGRRMDFLPDGEDVRFRNRIVENEWLILFGPSFVASLGYSVLRKRNPDRLRS